MPDIVKELSLNKHPKNCKNLSLVYAKNIQVSNDLSCIHNEEAIYEHTNLINMIKDTITQIKQIHIPIYNGKCL